MEWFLCPNFLKVQKTKTYSACQSGGLLFIPVQKSVSEELETW